MGRRAKQNVFRNQTWREDLVMYRIQIGEGYDGCIPKTVWFVQMNKETMFGNKWINIKGFDKRESAEELLNMLNSK